MSEWAEGHPRLTIALCMVVSSLVVWAPFAPSLDRIYRFWDGPPYIYIAKTLYDVPEDHPFVAHGLPREFFANHLPGYPLLIRALTPLTLGHYPEAMLLATLASSVAAALLFYELLLAFQLVANPLWTGVLFCLFPPRFVIYHSVGASEPFFMALLFAAILAFRAGRPWLVIMLVGLASITRIVGTLLVPAFGLLYLQRREWRNALLQPLALLGLLAVFGYYHLVFGDFFAYFHWTVGQAALVSPWPLEILFRYAASNKLHSVELYAWMYVLHAVGVAALWPKREVFAWSAIYFAFCLCITGYDLPRYLLPLAPFTILVAFDPVLGRRSARLALPLLLFADYLYAWYFIPKRMVSRGAWQALLQALGY